MQGARRGRLERFGRRMGISGASGVLMATFAVLVVLLAIVGVGRTMLTRGGFNVVRSGVTATQGNGQEQEPRQDEGQGTGDAHGEMPGASAEATGDAAAAEEREQEPVVERACVVVHVDGAVGTPGVYEIASSTPRVTDAVEAAGGLAPDADTTTINLAAPLADGQKVHVPAQGEEAVVAAPDPMATQDDGDALVNINTATADELQALPGIGEVTAQAIVEERERGGAFASPEDLMRVSGIGQKKFERLREQICV